MAEGVFVSYRRDDSPGHAGRLYDRLVEHFGPERVFIDVDSIDPGADFAEVIEGTLAGAAVVVVVIGPGWIHARDARGVNRLTQRDDFVHLEVRRALELKKRVIPVLVEGATVPLTEDLPRDLQALTRRNAFEISDARFHSDADRLAAAIEKLLVPAETAVIPTVGVAGSTEIPPERDGDVAVEGQTAAAAIGRQVGLTPPSRPAPSPRTDPAPAEPEADRPRLLVGSVRRPGWLVPAAIGGVVVLLAVGAWVATRDGGDAGVATSDEHGEVVTEPAATEPRGDQRRIRGCRR